MELTYKEFVEGINDKANIKQIDFSIEGYGHYRACSIYRENSEIRLRDGSIVANSRIVCALTKDKKEIVYFYGPFNEGEKIFRIGSKGRYTLKEMWKRVKITNIEYF